MSIKLESLLFLFVFVASDPVLVAEETDPLGRQLKSYQVRYAESAIKIDGRLDEPAWKSAAEMDSFEFPWWEAGTQEQTQAKLTWDNEYLYVSFVCEDVYISAEHVERDSPVYYDDCVEVFTSPNPDQLEKYFNIEMNVIEASLDFFHPEGPGTKTDWDPAIQIATTVDGTLNDDSDLDRGWVLEVAIPFSAFKDVAKNTPPHIGDVWRLNLNRLGGKTNPQKSQWSPGDPDDPNFHAPQYFGRVTFIK
jgi:hypothetical protein